MNAYTASIAPTTLFMSRQLVVQSLKLTYSKIARVYPNVMFTHASVVFNDGRPIQTIVINEHLIHEQPEHL